MKTSALICLFFACVLAADPFRNIGAITVDKGITWDDDPLNGSGVAAFNVFLADYGKTNFSIVATVSTNAWKGNPMTNWFGPKVLFVTAVGPSGLESAPSEMVLAEFKDGVPYSPRNIQIWEVIKASATNALTVISTNQSAPPTPP